MRPSNTALIRGRIASDFTLESTTKGVATCQFNVAVPRPRRKDAEDETDFIRVKIYGKTAEFVHKYFSKGELIALSGEIRVDQWTNREGDKRSQTYLLVESTEFVESKRSEDKRSCAPAADGDVAPSDTAEHEAKPISNDDELPF